MVLTSFFGKKPGPRDEEAAAQQTPGQNDQAELSTLDFSIIPSSQGRPVAASGMQIKEAEDDSGSVAEEAAMLYANGESAESEKLLRGVLEDGGSGVGEGLWMMLISLYRLTGQREQFESLVLQYATRFLKSPPPWEDQSGRDERSRGSAQPTVGIGLSLTAQSATQIEQMKAVGRKSHALRIDVGRLRSVDEDGARVLLQALTEMLADRVKVVLVNPEGLVELIRTQIEPGRKDHREMWLLMLQALQYIKDQDRFEQSALDYAITFEESPPSWEGRLDGIDEQAAQAPAIEIDTKMDEGLVLEGEICANAMESLKQLAALASKRTRLEVECVRLRRIDFVSAGSLFNILKTLQGQGKVVVLRNVNAMVAALLRIMAVDQVAQVMVRS